MKRPSYRAAIEWLALNDDNEWLRADGAPPSVAASLVADLFDVDTDRVTRDLKAKLAGWLTN